MYVNLCFFNFVHKTFAVVTLELFGQFSIDLGFPLSFLTLNLHLSLAADILQKPCPEPMDVGFVIATSSDEKGQFANAKSFASRIFMSFASPKSRAGVVSLQIVSDTGSFFVNTTRELNAKLNRLPKYTGRFGAAEIATSIEEIILRLSTDISGSKNRLIVLLVDADRADLSNLESIVGLVKRELAVNRVRLFVAAVGRNGRRDILKALTMYPDEVLMKERFDEFLENGMGKKVALSLCHMIGESIFEELLPNSCHPGFLAGTLQFLIV